MLRGQRHAISGLLESMAKVPWWGAIILAFVGFVMLHPFAIMEVAASGPVDDQPSFASKAFWRSLAGTVQYIVPAVLLVAPPLAALLNRFVKPRETR